MNILGIGGIGREPAAALLRDGQLVAAMEEVKIARRHQGSGLPLESLDACLEIAQVEPGDIDIIAVVRPVPANLAETLNSTLRSRFPRARMILVEHHLAHAASAFYASPFENATVLTLDRRGDVQCGARWIGSGNHLTLDSEMYFPDSLGDVYSRVTELLGFQSNADEHKTQWLSATGDDRYREMFLEILGGLASEMPRIDHSYFDSARLAGGGFSEKFFHKLGLGDAARWTSSDRANIAAGMQRAIEQVVIAMAKDARHVCIAGGLAFNAMLVAALESHPQFEGVFAQPAAGNSGTALGAVLHAWHSVALQKSRVAMGDYCYGPGFDAEAIKRVLENCKLRFRYLLTSDEVIETAVARLSENKIVAWMQGRMEFGPRALGNRSLLASPLDPYSTENLNAFIKRREGFRKFAASVPAELAQDYFETGPNARFLASMSQVRPAYQDRFAAAILSGRLLRVHAVSREDNPLYWRLLHEAGKRTGLPVLYNTSFNLFGEPLVSSPRDAVRSFYSSGVDTMLVGSFLLDK
jgi:carbamoyltransferase